MRKHLKQLAVIVLALGVGFFAGAATVGSTLKKWMIDSNATWLNTHIADLFMLRSGQADACADGMEKTLDNPIRQLGWAARSRGGQFYAARLTPLQLHALESARTYLDAGFQPPLSQESLDVLSHVTSQDTSTLKVGDPAPAFTVQTLDGRTIRLADFKGKFVLLDFWATWCGPCVAEVPYLKAVYAAREKDPRLVMVGLSFDSDADLYGQYVREHGFTWMQGCLGDWSKTSVPTDYGLKGIPAIVLIGPDGKIVAKGLRGPAIQRAVDTALGK